MLSLEKNEEFLRHIPQKFQNFGPCFFCAENFSGKNLSNLPRECYVKCHAHMSEAYGKGYACGAMKLYTYRLQVLEGNTDLEKNIQNTKKNDFTAPWSILDEVPKETEICFSKTVFISDWHMLVQ